MAARHHWAMAIDTRECIGCWTCAVACKCENNLPEGIWWCQVVTAGGRHPDTPAGAFPDLAMRHAVMSCQLCEEPACVAACPTEACRLSEEGVVVQDPDACMGCRTCIQACPYPGARVFLADEPAFATGYPVGALRATRHIKGTVEKCDLCHHLIARGEEPACVGSCPSGARVFGDLNDPESEISRVLASRAWMQLPAAEDTHPSLYYLK